MNSTFGRMIKGSALLTVGSTIANLLGMISTVILARALVPADFGIFTVGATVIAILSAISDLSIGQALIQRHEVSDDDINSAWTLNILRVVPVALCLFLASPLIADAFDDQRLTAVLIALGSGWMLTGFLSPKLSLLERELRFGQIVIMNIGQKVATVLVTVSIALIYRSYWALVIGSVAAYAATLCISYILAPFMPRFTLKGARGILSFSIWASLSTTVNTLNWRADYLLVGKFLDVTQLGYYSVGSNLAMLPTRQAIEPLTKTLFPGFSSLRGDKEQLRRAYQRAQAAVTALSLPIGVGVALTADLIVPLILGDRWLPAIFVVQTLSFIYGAQTIGSQYPALAMAAGATRSLFNRSVVMLIVRLSLLVTGLYFGGLRGMVIARLASALVSMGFGLYLVRRLIDLSIADQLRANARAITGTAIMAGCVMAAGHFLPDATGVFGLILRLAELGSVGLITYAASSYLLWIIAGRPSGPEAEAQRILVWCLARVRTARRGNAQT